METLLKSIDLIWRTYRCGSSCEPWGGSSWCTPCRNRPRRICELCASSTRRRIRCPSRGCRRSLRHRRSPFRRSLFRSPALDACGTPWNFEPPIPSRTIGHKTVESFSTSESEFLPGEREGSRGGRREGCGPLASFATCRVSIPAVICFDRKKFEGRIDFNSDMDKKTSSSLLYISLSFRVYPSLWMREWIRDKSEQHGFIREVFRMHYSSIDVLPIMTGSKGEKKKKWIEYCGLIERTRKKVA